MESSNDLLRYGECRGCLSPGRHRVLTNAYSVNGDRLIFIDQFSKCFNVLLSSHPDLSSLICTNCIRKLQEAYDFKTSVQAIENKLLAKIGVTVGINQQATEFVNTSNGQSCNEPFLFQGVMKQEFVSEEDEHQHSYDDDDSNDDDDDDDDDDDSNDKDYKDDNDDKDDKDDKDDDSEVDEKPLLPLEVTLSEQVPGEAELLRRFPRREPPPLPSRDSLFTMCPMYLGHLEALGGRTIEARDIKHLLEDPEPITKTSKRNKNKRVRIRKSLSHGNFASDVANIFEYSNATAFKSKMRSGFPCVYCKNIFPNPPTLRLHQSTHDKATLLPILRKFPKDNLIVYADITDLKCTICSQSIPSLADLKSHLAVAHNKKFMNETQDRVIPFRLEEKDTGYDCQFCGATFETFGAIDKHMNIHCKNFVCEKCGAGFVTQHRLKVHIYMRHPLKSGGKTCPICKKVFTTAHQFKIHDDIVHKKLKKMKCVVCGELFIDYFARQRHLEEKHGYEKLMYKCTLCDKQYNRKFSLTTHIKRCHHNEKNYQCELCPYMSFSKPELDDHKLKHTGEKNFQCLVCNKLFMRRKALNLHAKTHSNERKFFCHLCGASFLQNCSLESHLNSHRSEFDHFH